MMSRDEYQIRQESDYDRLTAKRPNWAAKNKTYLGWLNAGRQVQRGAVAKSYAVTVCVGVYMNPITGEDEPRMGTRSVSCFHIDDTQPRSNRRS